MVVLKFSLWDSAQHLSSRFRTSHIHPSNVQRRSICLTASRVSHHCGSVICSCYVYRGGKGIDSVTRKRTAQKSGSPGGRDSGDARLSLLVGVDVSLDDKNLWRVQGSKRLERALHVLRRIATHGLTLAKEVEVELCLVLENASHL